MMLPGAKFHLKLPKSMQDPTSMKIKCSSKLFHPQNPPSQNLKNHKMYVFSKNQCITYHFFQLSTISRRFDDIDFPIPVGKSLHLEKWKVNVASSGSLRVKIHSVSWELNRGWISKYEFSTNTKVSSNHAIRVLKCDFKQHCEKNFLGWERQKFYQCVNIFSEKWKC